MLQFADDHNDNRVFIDDTHSNEIYYCPSCGAPLDCKKGDIRVHHFAHKKDYSCSDSWEREGKYDITPWHYELQNLFPKENREVTLTLGNTSHRADVLVGNRIIEFQKSSMRENAFDDRNNFYLSLQYNVVWLFDLTDEYEKGDFDYDETGGGLQFVWTNPKKAFNAYDISQGTIDLFFQLKKGEEKSIVKVTGVSEHGFERFSSSYFMTREDFLKYCGMNDGCCLPPYRDDIPKNIDYSSFVEKYNVSLNKEQERALLSIYGSVLLLAVPGSGKTTVLVDRIGYMVNVKHIDPSSILAITYSKSAATEMKNRLISKFGPGPINKVEVRTINSLSLSIYKLWCAQKGERERRLLEGTNLRNTLVDIYRKCNADDFATEEDILDLEQAVNYFKNMCIDIENPNDIEGLNETLVCEFKSYLKRLEDNKYMDFDDQLVFAYNILKENQDVLDYYRGKFKYICVDEAQDTSKIQHKIIKLLVEGNNLFMVGDEDQSIYGFRGAYPKAFLNFKYDYKNPYILKMETNYRSTSQIVEKAKSFISQNKGRYAKNMISSRGDGDDVNLLIVGSREEQFNKMVEFAQNVADETAVLYRDNESSVVLVDLFLRKGISFALKKPEMNFFGSRVVRDIVGYLSLVLNDKDVEAFRTICNRGIIFLKSQQRDFAIRNCKKRDISIYQAVEEQMEYLPFQQRDRAKSFKKEMSSISKNDTALEAIDKLMQTEYGCFIKNHFYEEEKIGLLRILAKNENSINDFLKRIKYLEDVFSKEHRSNEKNGIILSTIHSSKGQEYNNVYIIDIYDKRFPSQNENKYARSKDNADAYQEERRLFYVGLTRAKSTLNIIKIDSMDSFFVDVLFPEERERRKKLAEEKGRQEALRRAAAEEEQRKREEADRIEALRKREEERKAEERLQEEERRRRFEEEQKLIALRAMPISMLVSQNDRVAIDGWGVRWYKCIKCNATFTTSDMEQCGGEYGLNQGICNVCAKPKIK